MKVYFCPQTIALGSGRPLNFFILVATLLEVIQWHHNITWLATSPNLILVHSWCHISIMLQVINYQLKKALDNSRGLIKPKEVHGAQWTNCNSLTTENRIFFNDIETEFFILLFFCSEDVICYFFFVNL